MKSWWPSRKWWAATVVAAGTVGTAWAQAGEWGSTLTITAVGLAVQRATSWLIPNADEASTRRARARVAAVEGSRRAPAPRATQKRAPAKRRRKAE